MDLHNTPVFRSSIFIKILTNLKIPLTKNIWDRGRIFCNFAREGKLFINLYNRLLSGEASTFHGQLWAAAKPVVDLFNHVVDSPRRELPRCPLLQMPWPASLKDKVILQEFCTNLQYHHVLSQLNLENLWLDLKVAPLLLPFWVRAVPPNEVVPA